MFRALLLVLSVLFATGCTQLTAKHLQRDVLIQSMNERTTEMRYVSFTYKVVPLDREVGILGTVRYTGNNIPDWATWYNQFRLFAYVCDTKGDVLASGETTLIPRNVSSNDDFPFEIRIPLYMQPTSRPLQIAFGYRVVMTDNPGGKNGTAPTRVFVATESALAQ